MHSQRKSKILCLDVLDETLGNIRAEYRPSFFNDVGDISGFGSPEIDKKAQNLILFFQNKGLWCSFTHHELETFYLRSGIHDKAPLMGLAFGWHHEDSPIGSVWRQPNGEFLVQKSDGSFCITILFVERCARIAPSSIVDMVHG